MKTMAKGNQPFPSPKENSYSFETFVPPSKTPFQPTIRLTAILAHNITGEEPLPARRLAERVDVTGAQVPYIIHLYETRN